MLEVDVVVEMGRRGPVPAAPPAPPGEQDLPPGAWPATSPPVSARTAAPSPTSSIARPSYRSRSVSRLGPPATATRIGSAHGMSVVLRDDNGAKVVDAFQRRLPGERAGRGGNWAEKKTDDMRLYYGTGQAARCRDAPRSAFIVECGFLDQRRRPGPCWRTRRCHQRAAEALRQAVDLRCSGRGDARDDLLPLAPRPPQAQADDHGPVDDQRRGRPGWRSSSAIPLSRVGSPARSPPLGPMLTPSRPSSHRMRTDEFRSTRTSPGQVPRTTPQTDEHRRRIGAHGPSERDPAGRRPGAVPPGAHRLLLPDARLGLRGRGRRPGDDGAGVEGPSTASRAGRRCARGCTASPPTSASTCSAAASAGPGHGPRPVVAGRRASRGATRPEHAWVEPIPDGRVLPDRRRPGRGGRGAGDRSAWPSSPPSSTCPPASARC